MADVRQFFVVVFSRTEANRIRTDAAIKALSEPQATWVASHFAEEEEGAIVLSRSESVRPGKGANVRIRARFGGAVPVGSSIWVLLRKALGTLVLPILS